MQRHSRRRSWTITYCFLLTAWTWLLGPLPSRPALAPQPPTTSTIGVDDVELGVRTMVDPRIELMTTIQLLSGYFLISQHDSDYKREVREHFARYRANCAVTMFGEMSKGSFNFDVVPKAMMALSEPPRLEPQRPFSTYVTGRAGGEEQLRRWVASLGEFAVESHFVDFFAAHHDLWRRLESQSQPATSKAVAALRNYLGTPLRNCTLVLGPLLHDGGFADSFSERPGTLQAYAFLGPMGVAQGIPDFGDSARVGGLVWHEFSHTVINPLIEERRDILARSSALYAPIAEAMKREAYPDWETALKEHLIRAITIRLTFRELGKQAGERALEGEKQKGFRYVEALAASLEEYEHQRARYPTISDFLPRLTVTLDELAKAQSRSPTKHEGPSLSSP